MSKLTVGLKIIERYARVFKNEYLKELGLVNRQAEIILALRRNPGSSQEELADALLINKSGVTRQLTVMEEEGLVCRSMSPTDRRVTQVFLTEKAENLIPAIREINQKWSDFVTDGLSEQEQQWLLDVVENVKGRIYESLEGREKP